MASLLMESIFCNKCGKMFSILDEQQPSCMCGKLGYGSVHDGDMLDLHLCCDCLDELIESCAITPVSDRRNANE